MENEKVKPKFSLNLKDAKSLKLKSFDFMESDR